MLAGKVLLPLLLVASIVVEPSHAHATNSCIDLNSANHKCLPGLAVLNLNNCGLADEDVTDLENCFFAVGYENILELFMEHNNLDNLPVRLFDPMTSLKGLHLRGNGHLKCLPRSCATTVDVDNDNIRNHGGCVCPPFTFRKGRKCYPGPRGYSCDHAHCHYDTQCSYPQTCCLEKSECTVIDPVTGACGDPHMTGFRGQKFDFTGEDDGWYALISDLPAIHINMRVSAPVPVLPVITYITGLSLIVADGDGFDHSIVISARDPHNLESACPAGVSPCLADGSLSVIVDGEETLFAPGTVSLTHDITISAVNLPGACRSFGFEKYWERKKLENATGGRRLGESEGMDMWILGDPTATNLAECAVYVAAAMDGASDLFSYQSEHASFQIVTPGATIRLSHGKLHQLSMRDPTDQFDLPEHLTWQMNVAIDRHDISLHATGVLGETFVPTLDDAGAPIMEGMGAIGGIEEDYRVAGPLGAAFAQGTHSS